MKKIYFAPVLFIIMLLGVPCLKINAQNLVPVNVYQYDSTAFEENFEAGGAGWAVSGEFEIGTPTAYWGPIQGSISAKTDLDSYINSGGNYLYSPYFSIPTNVQDINLSFIENYYFYGGEVYIYIDNGFGWNTISSRSLYYWYSTYNTAQNFDLSAYVGQTVRIIIYVYSYNPSNYGVYGYYADVFNVTCKAPIAEPAPAAGLLDPQGNYVPSGQVVNDYYSTIEPIVYHATLANFGLDTLLVVDSIVSELGYITASFLEDSIPYAFGTPITVTVLPTVDGLFSDTLRVFSNDPNSPWFVVFSGSAAPAALEPMPELSYMGNIQTPENFFNPLVVIDTSLIPETSTDVYFDLHLTNKGALPLDINNYYFKYGGGQAFWIDSWSDDFIEYGDTATITIGFSAQRSRQQVFALTYEFETRDNETAHWSHWFAANSSFDGTYLEIDGPWFSAGPDSLVVDFGTVNVGSSAYQNYIWLKNLGSVPLNITMEIVGNDFSFIGENPINLKPGQGNYEGEEGIVFTPSDSTGIIEGLLIFHHNDTTAGQVDTVYLRGKGYIPEVLQPANFVIYYKGNEINREDELEIDMGTAIIGNETQEVAFSIVNTGETGGYIDWYYLNNYFYWVDENGSTWNSRNNIYIDAGDTLHFDIQFDPDYGYIFEEWTSIYLEDDYNFLNISIIGYGIERHAFNLRDNYGYDVDEYDTYNTYSYNGYQETRIYWYTNLHESPVTIDSVTISDNDATTVLNAIGLPVTLEPGESYEYRVSFDPTLPDGLHDATIKVYSTNLVEPIYVYYLGNIADGYAEFELDCLNEGAIDFYGGDELDFNTVSSIDGTRIADLRLYSTNGYNVVIDSTRFYELPPSFSFAGLADNQVISSGDSADFTVTYEPRGTEGWEYAELSLFYIYSDNPDMYVQDYEIDLNGEAEPDYTQAAELSVAAGNTTIPNDGTVNFGSVPANGGIINLIVSLKNSGVDIVLVDTVTFSNPAFSMMEWDGMFSDFYVWYEYTTDILLYFNPDDALVIDGTMTIVSNDPTNPSYVVNLIGTGTTGTHSAPITQSMVYPNPGSETIYVVTSSENPSRIEIFNSSGKLVYNNFRTNNQSIDISSFEKGIYLVRISNNSEIHQHKLVVE